VIWGLKPHEDWAFKATLLRFARGSQPVHILLRGGPQGRIRLQGWVVSRSWEAFRAASLSSDHLSELSRVPTLLEALAPAEPKPLLQN
jgi:hypothetical protein